MEAHAAQAAPWLLSSQPDVAAAALAGEQMEGGMQPPASMQVGVRGRGGGRGARGGGAACMRQGMVECGAIGRIGCGWEEDCASWMCDGLLACRCHCCERWQRRRARAAACQASARQWRRALSSWRTWWGSCRAAATLP